MSRLYSVCAAMLTPAILCLACSKEPAPLSPKTASPTASLKTSAPRNVQSTEIQTLELDFDKNGTIDITTQTTYGLDAHGNIVTLRHYAGPRQGQPPTLLTAVEEYDVHGNVIAVIQEIDEPMDGIIDDRTTLVTLAFDRQGRPIHQDITDDTNVDGVIDEHRVFSNQFDARGLLVGQDFGTDTRVYENDAHGNTVHMLGERTTFPFTRQEQWTEYNVHGVLTHDVLHFTSGNRLSRRVTETTAVDGQGYPTIQIQSLYDGSRLVSQLERTISYDGHHRPVLQVETDAQLVATTRFEYAGSDDVTTQQARPAAVSFPRGGQNVLAADPGNRPADGTKRPGLGW